MLKSKLSPFTVFYENGPEYHQLKNEIFTQDAYYFETTNPQPRIIDVGAHIGLATLYFKKLYPNARITAIEPNPHTFKILEKNIFENGLKDAELHSVALAAQTGTAEFFMDSTAEKWLSTASFTEGAWTRTQTSTSFQVPTAPLSQFLTEPTDFLKMDIEGTEQEVLMSSTKSLHLIKEMLVEFHPLPQQSLAKLVTFLEEHNFRVELWKDGKSVIAKRAHGLVYINARQ